MTDTKPDATAVVPGNAGDDAKYASNPADFEADRAAGDNDVRHRAVFSGYWDLSLLEGLLTASPRRPARRLVDELDRRACRAGQPYSERVTNDLNNDGNRSNDIVPGSRNTHQLPTAYNLDLRLSRRIPLGPDGAAGADRRGVQPLQPHEHHAPSATRSTTSPAAALVPQLEPVQPAPRTSARTTAPRSTSTDTQRIVQIAAKVTF
mgnify:CR=1 FL=1